MRRPTSRWSMPRNDLMSRRADRTHGLSDASPTDPMSLEPRMRRRILPSPRAPSPWPEREGDAIERICAARGFEVHFQPVVRLLSGEVLGYEALPRAPLDGPFANAAEMLDAAAGHGLLATLEVALCEQAVQKFTRLALPGQLVLALSADTLIDAQLHTGGRPAFLRALEASRLVVEPAGHRKPPTLERLCEAAMLLRSVGAQLLVDDLGRGFSSLALWPELKPELVKIGPQFVHEVHRNVAKFQFLKSLQQIADGCGSRLLAVGIESNAELAALRDLGIAYGQGGYIARPAPAPAAKLRPEVVEALRTRRFASLPEAVRLPVRRSTVGDKLLVRAPSLEPVATNRKVFETFDAAPELHALAIVAHGRPRGLIERARFVELYASGSASPDAPCLHTMNARPLLVDKDLPMHEIPALVAGTDLRDIETFIFTSRGVYAGIGSGHDLIREITLMQIDAARYANPLTLLPGNVPIDEQIATLLGTKTAFVAAYCDLNHFKQFNDAYGYRRGDEMIKLAARTLTAACEPRRDFIGHIGGDDFILVFRSSDWRARCEQALKAFGAEAPTLCDAEDRARGALKGEDRAGNVVYSPLTTLAIGAVPVPPGRYESHLQVSEAASEAKRQAKRVAGNALFVERRRSLGGAKRA